jgi:hypothetical protein
VGGVLEVDVSIEGAGEFEISAILSLLVLRVKIEDSVCDREGRRLTQLTSEPTSDR